MEKSELKDCFEMLVSLWSARVLRIDKEIKAFPEKLSHEDAIRLADLFGRRDVLISCIIELDDLPL